MNNIGKAVVVVIADGDAHSPTLIRNAGFFRYIFKFPISEIADKARISAAFPLPDSALIVEPLNKKMSGLPSLS